MSDKPIRNMDEAESACWSQAYAATFAGMMGAPNFCPTDVAHAATIVADQAVRLLRERRKGANARYCNHCELVYKVPEGAKAVCPKCEPYARGKADERARVVEWLRDDMEHTYAHRIDLGEHDPGT